ncbi:MAG: alpha/beta hydrolase family protein [Tepidisphaerales bacterium]
MFRQLRAHPRIPHFVPSCLRASVPCLLFLACLAAGPATRPGRPYEVAHDKPLDAKIAVLEKTDAWTRYHVEINGIAGDRVPAIVYVPTDAKPKHPTVLLQYGSGGNKNTNYIVAIGQKFARHGFVAMTIDIPNRGERRKVKTVIEGNFLETLGDYSRAVDYLYTRDDVDRSRLVYMGISWGAITGITFAAHDERIKVVVSLVGGGNFIGWMPPQLVNDEMRREVEQFDPVYHVALIEPRPLLLLNVQHDLLVSPFMSQSLHKAAGPTADKRWLDTDHIFSTVDREATAEEVIRWVEGKLPR